VKGFYKKKANINNNSRSIDRGIKKHE